MIELIVAKSAAGDALAQRLSKDHDLDAPYLLDGEVVSALLGLRRGQKITDREADAALASYSSFPVQRHDVLALWPRIKYLHSRLSGYDAQYVALAEALGTALITADARIGRSGAADCPVEVLTRSA